MDKSKDRRANLTIGLLLDLIEWVRSYETWVVEEIGVQYRQETVANWKFGTITTPGERMALAWRQLGITIADDLSWLRIPVRESPVELAEAS